MNKILISTTFNNLKFNGLKNSAQAITKAITNKGFSGMPSASLASSFVSGDTTVAPKSLTGHSLNRYR